jgi:pimeloyl-ACP methyl ester carboxylesterase
MVLSNRTVTVDGTGAVQVSFSDAGNGPHVLLFHAGAGPSSVSQFADLLAATARVIVPVHPGFDGTPRPPQLASVRALAGVYTQLIRDLNLTDVCVVGNSFGGWVAAEIALAESTASAPRVSSVALVDAAASSLTPRQCRKCLG